MIKNSLARFITIEGIEGVGKSTAVQFLQKYLTEKKINFITTREPGGTPIAEAVRQILLQQYQEEMLPETELLLMFAGRAQHVAKIILPALNQGAWVICDRFTDASYAYQGAGRGLGAAKVEIIDKWVVGDLKPDRTLLLDVPVALSQARVQQRTTLDRIELEQAQFFERARACYLERAQQYPQQYRIINSAETIENVQEQLKLAISDLL